MKKVFCEVEGLEMGRLQIESYSMAIRVCGVARYRTEYGEKACHCRPKDHETK